jgi:16S rRNA (adenine1518-N6/adenine1519-N6)-dimethyltransferase
MTLAPLNVPDLLKLHQLSPKKGLGQNFLIDPIYLERIVEAADIPESATILEIGPGLGNLTRYLAEAAKQVVAVELDGRFIPVLENVTSQWQNITIIQGDILKLDPTDYFTSNDYLVIANIPYYITSALLRHLLGSQVKPKRLILTVQLEVAKRICAKPGNLSLLGLSVQVYGKAEIIFRIPAGAFHPSPKVDSATVRIDLHSQPGIPHEKLDAFFSVARAGFRQKRKMLRNALASGLKIPARTVETLLLEAKIDPQRRAQTLSLEEWERLTEKWVTLTP